MTKSTERSRPERLGAFFEALWRDYVAMTPSASQIHALFAADNPGIANDHLAYRTFDLDPIDLASLETRSQPIDLTYYRPPLS